MHTANRRIATEIEKLRKTPSSMFYAYAMDDDIFEWHFTLRGVEGSPFEDGLYHGKI